MNKSAIIEKIKKCLRLSKSANAHEANAALRQARKLMDMHGITGVDMAHAEIQESAARAGAYSRPAAWEAMLADVVSSEFGCSLIFVSESGKGRWNFIGFGPSAEIANYAFTVLLRQLKSERRNYIKTTLKRCVVRTQRRRADLFCEGWVGSVRKALSGLKLSDENAAAIDSYITATRGGSLAELTTTKRSEGRLGDRDYDDMFRGHLKGRDARIDRGVGGTGQGRLEQRQ